MIFESLSGPIKVKQVKDQEHNKDRTLVRVVKDAGCYIKGEVITAHRCYLWERCDTAANGRFVYHR